MQIVNISIDEIKEYENNPRHNDDAVEPVAKSIQEFGFKVPCIIDSNNVLVTGHTRVKAARLLGMNEVPCIIADDLTEEQIKAFRLADNKVSEIANWDYQALEIELEGIEDIDMSDFGFIEIDDIDIDSFFEDAPPKPDPEPEFITCPHCGESFEK